MLFNQSDHSFYPFRAQNMSKDGLVSNGSRMRSHSHNDRNTRSQLLYKGRGQSRSSSQKAKSSNRAKRDVGQTGTLPASSAPSSPPLREQTSDLDHERISTLASELQRLLRKRGRHAISTTYDLRALWSASQEPPITKDTLRELDLEKLYNSLYLRHDLNFDRDIKFTPRSVCTPGGREKQMEAQRYWDAIEIELSLYASYLEDLSLNLYSDNLLDARCSLPKPRSLQKVPQRLKGMIQAICRIVKTLVSPTKWAAVATRLSPSLFVQELEHGQCDIESLFCWVGTLLLESCAPSRDGRIASMVETISKGSRDKDAHMLRRGLQDLFCLLETMKLVRSCIVFKMPTLEQLTFHSGYCKLPAPVVT